ncbi:MAG: IS200/IS605 family transposase [Candidatus Neomarinimicrobiota bacterium]
MATYRQILYHIIIEPYKREKVLTETKHKRLFAFIRGFVDNKKCFLYAINGTNDHIHMLISIKLDIAISDFMKDLKVSSSKFIKRENIFPFFRGWARGYSIFTKDYYSLETIKRYIDNQKAHHQEQSYYKEFDKILKKNGL